MKPFSESCEQNKNPILNVLRREFADIYSVLEVGSGTGQHAVYFAQQLPHLQWTCSDLEECHDGIHQWINEAGLPNIHGPLLLDARENWPTDLRADAVFSANAIHIMSWDAVVGMIVNVAGVLDRGGILCLYGPFMYNGEHTSDSNARFDGWLRQRDPLSGVRDVRDLAREMNRVGLVLERDYEMPVNNRTLIWKRV